MNPLQKVTALMADHDMQKRSLKNMEGWEGRFPGKLHDLLEYVEREGLQFIISWIREGRAVMVHNSEKLVEILPLFFGQTKYRSFQRQLNMWSFERIQEGPEKGAFWHPYFIRGMKSLCQNISRNSFKVASRIQPEADSSKTKRITHPKAEDSPSLPSSEISMINQLPKSKTTNDTSRDRSYMGPPAQAHSSNPFTTRYEQFAEGEIPLHAASGGIFHSPLFQRHERSSGSEQAGALPFGVEVEAANGPSPGQVGFGGKPLLNAENQQRRKDVEDYNDMMAALEPTPILETISILDHGKSLRQQTNNIALPAATMGRTQSAGSTDLAFSSDDGAQQGFLQNIYKQRQRYHSDK